MQKKIATLKEEIQIEVQKVFLQENENLRQKLFELKMQFLGKTGKLTDLLKSMKDVAPELRPEMGKYVNELRDYAEKLFAEKERLAREKEMALRYEREKIDITAPAIFQKKGGLHPITLIQNELIAIFTGFGFTVFDSTEFETDYYNFQALNIPEDHPSRDMQDTFFIHKNLLLRSQTSAGQVHVMEQQLPPIKILTTGRVYRSDSDATHSPMFHQMEGLVVDKNITLCDLKGLLDAFAKRMFDCNTKTRLRPSYFPFTEPSVEVDLSCVHCHGKGCKICKNTGWIEILGAGMVNERVLQTCKIDTAKYSGFAFGLGIERIAMIKYGIPDIRLFFENDIRFLKQFNSAKGEK